LLLGDNECHEDDGYLAVCICVNLDVAFQMIHWLALVCSYSLTAVSSTGSYSVRLLSFFSCCC